ncbi:DUF2875 family protein [Chitinivorax sp. B]|uniref:type VI lipase adapter Tla3 domain-containing protein n=1 Tax=Chitinivorax sp. B TaxID=2502235 RepID=UPI0010F8334A|nr:DUF2875 family protein [Chitinivorax sp. B]
MSKPAFRPYLVWSLLASLLIVPAWLALMMFTFPLDPETSMINRILLGLVLPFTLTVLAGCARYAQVVNAPATATQAANPAQADPQSRDYVLEIIGVGVTYDKFRQRMLWEALRKGNAFTLIRDMDPKKQEWMDTDKIGRSGGRALDALENGAKYLPTYWGIPVFSAEATSHNPSIPDDEPNSPRCGLACSVENTGMMFHIPIPSGRRLGEHPDRVLDDVFAFFDTNPDVPFIIVDSRENPRLRDVLRVPGTQPMLRTGRYTPELADSTALFVLARRERAEPLRRFAFDDPPNKGGIARELWEMHLHLSYALPNPRKAGNAKKTMTLEEVASRPLSRDESSGIKDFAKRDLRADEWLRAGAIFAKRPSVTGNVVSMLNPLKPRIPNGWQPTPWFPIPWNKEQLEAFDSRPTLGYLHRPTWVKLTDDDGKPLIRRDDRTKALSQGWQQALQTLPETDRQVGPARVVIATGGDTEKLLTLHGALNQYHEQGGPAYDPAKATQFIDTDKRLGNTGPATLFMQMAIGTMGSYYEGGTSAAINLRDDKEASIVMITPPPEAKRKSQGDYPWRHKGSLAIDPANYN